MSAMVIAAAANPAANASRGRQRVVEGTSVIARFTSASAASSDSPSLSAADAASRRSSACSARRKVWSDDSGAFSASASAGSRSPATKRDSRSRSAPLGFVKSPDMIDSFPLLIEQWQQGDRERGAGAVQARFDGAERHALDLGNLLQRLAMHIEQHKHAPLRFGQRGDGPLELLMQLSRGERIVGARLRVGDLEALVERRDFQVPLALFVDE